MPDRADMFGFIEAIRDETLANGLRVLFLPRPEIPSVALACYLPAGATLDPATALGTANLAARGIGDGTPTRTKEELDETIDFVGGSYQFSAGMEGASGGMQFLAKDLPLAIELLSDTLINSTYPDEEVERGRKQIEGSIRSQLERPGDLCERAYVEAVLAGSPYGHNVDGTLEAIHTLQPEDLRAFHALRYRPDGAILAVAGDFAPDQLLADIADRFGAWTPGAPTNPPPALPTAPATVQTQVIDRPIQQANVRLGFPTIARLHPDYYPFMLMNYVYGASSLSSRIGVTVRDNQGLAYSVSSRYTPMRHLGIFTVVLQTSNATTRQALKGVRDEMVKMQEEVITDEELADARSYFRDRFPLTIETNGAMAGQLLNIARYGLPLTHFSDHLDQIDGVAKADIQRAAQTYLNPEAYVLTIVGNAAEAGYVEEAAASAVTT